MLGKICGKRSDLSAEAPAKAEHWKIFFQSLELVPQTAIPATPAAAARSTASGGSRWQWASNSFMPLKIQAASPSDKVGYTAAVARILYGC
jgi:hypothetical protein